MLPRLPRLRSAWHRAANAASCLRDVRHVDCDVHRGHRRFLPHLMSD